MTGVQKPKGRESKRKSEVVTVRLDPKLKYLAELAARRQRRTLSSFIEWAIADSLSRVHPAFDPHLNEKPASLADVAMELWDIDEADRFARLATQFPELLDHEEQKLWKLICECDDLWNFDFGPDPRTRFYPGLIHERLREHWQTLRSIARGEKAASELPFWKKSES